jgi:hypothetical protein
MSLTAKTIPGVVHGVQVAHLGHVLLKFGCSCLVDESGVFGRHISDATVPWLVGGELHVNVQGLLKSPTLTTDSNTGSLDGCHQFDISDRSLGLL